MHLSQKLPRTILPGLVVSWLVLGLTLLLNVQLSSGSAGSSNPGANRTSKYLADVMDQFHDTFDVYTDSHAAGNHFAARGKMSSSGDADALPAMIENWKDNPHSGIDCIKTTFISKGNNWGGWYFMNGALQGSQTSPQENWGTFPNAGIDLSGATQLSFWAKGAQGGEKIEFFAFGIGYLGGTGVPIAPFPDSSRKASTDYVTLSSQWTKYTINLNGKNLGSVLGGFGWVTSAEQTGRDITFFLDDIQYDKPRLNEPRFLVSYQTIDSANDFDVVMRNVAFTYDNDLALLSFLASGDKERARYLADALVYAQSHDRYFHDGRIRNAYQGGDLVLPPGWSPNGQSGTVRMPGWFDSKYGWSEDMYQVSTDTGNMAWTMLALLAYYELEGGEQYLSAVEQMGNWVEACCRDTGGEQNPGGYRAGFKGWENSQTALTYKATEHNIDLYAAFQRLFLITGDDVWRERAEHAKNFVQVMWDPVEHKFWTGTATDGVTINKDVIPVDIQVWAILSLKDDIFSGALDYAEMHHAVGSGFDFNQDRDGVWYEGTSQVAATYGFLGQYEKFSSLIASLQSSQLESGGMFAADRDGLTTGFNLYDGNPWLYFHRLHVGATAWLSLAEMRVNPFWLQDRDFYWPWYDSKTMQNWILMANPAGGSNLSFNLSIGGDAKSLADSFGLGPGVVSGGDTLVFSQPGLMDGSVKVTSQPSARAIVSQRSLMGNSFEEVLGTDSEKLSDHFYWTWYDQKSPGYTNWVLIANPSATEWVHAVITFTNAEDVTPVSAEIDIAPGKNWTPTFPGKMGGPVEVKAYLAGAGHSWPTDKRNVIASQRVLSNYGAAFNEVPGIPAGELSADYLWTWYDQASPGYTDWVLIANPNDAPVTYQIKIGSDIQPCPVGGCIIAARDKVTHTFNGKIDGPLEVIATGGNVIASQRIVASSSFEEVPGYPKSTLASDYHWTWYDMASAGSANWVLVANPGDTEVHYQISIAGMVQDCEPGKQTCTIAAHDKATPIFPGKMNGPVEVSADGNVVASQRVTWNGYFNEVLGTVLD
ncbi:MAG: hypothetical protein ACYC4D_01225 [Thermoleophilia bacterium]